MRQTLEFHEESVGGQTLAAGPFWALVPFWALSCWALVPLWSLSPRLVPFCVFPLQAHAQGVGAEPDPAKRALRNSIPEALFLN